MYVGSEGDTGSIRVWSGSGEFEEIEIQANFETARISRYRERAAQRGKVI
jgi:hypothetical protein